MDIKDLLGDQYRDDMTDDEVESAVKAKYAPEVAAAQAEATRYKNATTKANSEAADYKRQLRDRQTEEEKATHEAEENLKAITAERDALKREMQIGKHQAEFLAQGYDPKLALDTATALYEGDTTKVFAAMKQHQEAREKTLRADLMRETPQPTAGGNGGNHAVDYSKQIADAQANGDYARVAALLRQQQSAATT